MRGINNGNCVIPVGARHNKVSIVKEYWRVELPSVWPLYCFLDRATFMLVRRITYSRWTWEVDVMSRTVHLFDKVPLNPICTLTGDTAARGLSADLLCHVRPVIELSLMSLFWHWSSHLLIAVLKRRVKKKEVDCYSISCSETEILKDAVERGRKMDTSRLKQRSARGMLRKGYQHLVSRKNESGTRAWIAPHSPSAPSYLFLESLNSLAEISNAAFRR